MLDYRIKYYTRKVLSYLFIVAGLIVFTLEGAIPLFPFGALISVLLTTIAALIVGFMYRKVWLNPALYRFSKKVLIIGLVVIIPAYATYKVQIYQNFENSKLLAKSVFKYQAKHGSFPKALNELVPEYFEKIPPVYLGVFPRHYEYEYIEPIHGEVHGDKPAGFYMEFRGYLGVKYSFLSYEKQWKLVDY